MNTHQQAHQQAHQQDALDFGAAPSDPPAKPAAPPVLTPGQTARIGDWEVRNFHGYYQSREGGKGNWQFHISGFDSSSSGQAGYCTLIMADGSRDDVAIDARNRITVLGVKYGCRHWKH